MTQKIFILQLFIHTRLNEANNIYILSIYKNQLKSNIFTVIK